MAKRTKLNSTAGVRNSTFAGSSGNSPDTGIAKVGAGLDKFFERAREAKATEAAAAQAVKDSAMMSANLKADLSVSNTPTVNSNPTEVGSVPTASQIKRRRAKGALSSALGINT